MVIGADNTARHTLGMPSARLADLRTHAEGYRGLLEGKTASYREDGRHRQIRFLIQVAIGSILNKKCPFTSLRLDRRLWNWPLTSATE